MDNDKVEFEESSTLIAQNKRLNKQIKVMFRKCKKEIDKNNLENPNKLIKLSKS